MKTKRSIRRNKNNTRRGGAKLDDEEVVGEELVIDLNNLHKTDTDKDDINISIVNDADVMGKDENGNIESKQTVSRVNELVTIKIFPNLKEIGKGNWGLSSSCRTLALGQLSWNYMSYKGSSKLNEVNNCVGLISSTEKNKVTHFQDGRKPKKLNDVWVKAMNVNYDITKKVNFKVQLDISVKDNAETQRTKMLDLLSDMENAVIVGSHNQFRKGLFGIDEKIMNCACIHITINPLLRDVNADLIYNGEPEITNSGPCPKDEGYLVDSRTNIKYMCEEANKSGYLIEFSENVNKEKGVSLSAKKNNRIKME